MKRKVYIISLVFLFFSFSYVYFSPPPHEAFMISGSFVNIGARMKFIFPNGLPENVFFEDAIKDQIKSTVSSKNETNYELMSTGYNMYHCNFENYQMRYSFNGARVVCWTRVFSIKGYYYVMLFSDWNSRIAKDKPELVSE